MTREPVAQATVRFILDAPADVDFFETHTDIAKAIVGAVQTNPEIKVVGLLGRWGSGKSTVAKTIIKLLTPTRGSGFRVFQYDAWLHQSDPLRRSFLESLIRFLIDDDAPISKSKWTRELEKLTEPVELSRTIETPSLALWALTLLAVPIGLSFLDLETLKQAFGPDANPVGRWTFGVSLALILLPLVTWLAVYLYRRPWVDFRDKEAGFRRKVFWRFVDADGEPASPLQFLEDGQARHTTTQTFRALEPTSLEFGAKFQEIMREATADGARLIILIDNLDRIAAEEALQMWATIRSFFLADHRTEDATHESYHPTVILPIDRHAIEQLFAGAEGQDGRARARSFMDKTFDVSFEVTEPVDSDWRAFWDRQMAWMFGDAYQAEWGFRTRRLFESHLTRISKSRGRSQAEDPLVVTPREINKLLNKIGALYLQWQGADIPIDVMALYVIRRAEIDGDLLKFLKQEVSEVSTVAPEWQRQLAALHYGVRVDKAAQVLLEEPIRQAIQDRDQAGIQAVASIPGFGETLEFGIANLPPAEGLESALDVLEKAIAVLESVEMEGTLWTAACWRNLTDQFLRLSPTSPPNVGALHVVEALRSRVEFTRRADFLDAAAELLSRLLSLPRENAGDDLRIGRAAEQLIDFALTHKLEVPTFKLHLEPTAYLLRIGQLTAASKLRPRLRSDHGGDELGSALQEMIVAKEVQSYVPSVIRSLTLAGGHTMYAADPEIDFSAVADKAEEVARNPGSDAASAHLGIMTLAELAFRRDEGREKLVGLINDGILATRLNEAAAQSNWASAAELIAVMIWGGGKFDAPSAFSWWEYPSRDPRYIERILRALAHYFPSAIVRVLWNSRAKNGVLTRSFVEKIIEAAVEADLLGPFNAKPVLERLTEYTSALPFKLRYVFLAQVERRADFLETLEQGPLGPHSHELVNYLERKGGDQVVRAREIIHNRVEGADEAGWSAAIKTGAEPFKMGLDYAEGGGELFASKSPLFFALQEAIDGLANGADKSVIARWFSLSALVKVRTRKALFKSMRRSLAVASPKQALHILRAGGVAFLRSAGFDIEPDRSVAEVIIPQIDTKNGRSWLKDNADELAGCVQKSGSPTRDSLRAALEVLLKSSVEERRYSADFLLHQWKLNR